MVAPANATTAVAYSDGPYAFTIPAPQIEGGQPSNTTGNIAFSYEPQTRENNLCRLWRIPPRAGCGGEKMASTNSHGPSAPSRVF